MNFFDKAVAAVAPERAMRRAAARMALDTLERQTTVKNSGYGNYGANVDKKSMRGWMFRGGSAKEDIEDNLDVLRQRSRDAYMGIPIANGALKTLNTNTICDGLMPTPQVDADYLGITDEQADDLRAQIVREFSLWADDYTCDADHMGNFYELQKLAYMGYLMNGDFVALLVTQHIEGQPYDLRVRVIEADRLCSPGGYDRLSPGEVQGHHVARIVQGVETDESGAVVAYWICNQHPLAATYYADKTWQRVEAYGARTGRRNVLHGMQRERAGQVRGVPTLAPVLESLKKLGRYTDAELDAAVIGAIFAVFIEKEVEANGKPFGEVPNPDDQVDGPPQNSIELAPGAIVDMAPGEKANFADPTHPNTGFDSFFNAIVKQMSAALQLPSEVLFKQFSTSYSAARGALNEFWRSCDKDREWFADAFCRPIYETWFREAVANGRINAPGFFTDPAIAKAYMACKWNGPARTNLNPKDEAEAAQMRVNSGFSTAEDETATMTGGSYMMNMRQRMREAKLKREVDKIANDTGSEPNGQSEQPAEKRSE
jgi:lambda family phage portal protein